MVFQDYALFPHLSVAKNVAFGLERKGLAKPEIRQRVEQALQMVELTDKADRWPHELSGGQRQRVALARALVRGPRVLLLDEPLSALDAGLRESMQVELKKLHERLGITFVMVTHDQTEALVMSDRIVVMRQGRIAQVGTPDQLYNFPRTSYVASFIGSTNLFDGTVRDSNEKNLVVQTAAGAFNCPPRIGLRAGEKVKLGVRPEHLRPLPPGGDGTVNVFHGAVQDVLFHGNYTRFRCAVGESNEQLDWDWLQPRHDSGARRPSTGTRVSLAAAPSDLFVFSQEEAQ
jgi:putative spermidine/putrescine transport system ATP-binding protein/spermidine/putrescine transport system ATP-binding protein